MGRGWVGMKVALGVGGLGCGEGVIGGGWLTVEKGFGWGEGGIGSGWVEIGLGWRWHRGGWVSGGWVGVRGGVVWGGVDGAKLDKEINALWALSVFPASSEFLRVEKRLLRPIPLWRSGEPTARLRESRTWDTARRPDSTDASAISRTPEVVTSFSAFQYCMCNCKIKLGFQLFLGIFLHGF